ncbi:MAG: DUF1028 domain-containing protein [Gemmatimonadota bacterium]|nr:DUF1028 domain-containing protein [Gemmatimonadota bacterium]
MSDDKLPRIPSFEELGIGEDEIEELEREIAEEAAARREHQGGEGGPAATKAPATGSGRRKAERKTAEATGGSAPSKRAERREKSERPKRKTGRKAKRAEKRESRKRAAADAVAIAAASPPTPAPWGGLRGPATLLLLLVTAWLSSSYRTIPAPVPSTAPDSVFSSARAMSHLARIASEARPPGSPNHARVRDYLIDRLAALGHAPTVQTATSFDTGYGGMTVATVRNVMARIPGTEPGGPAVLVTAHYDSREISLGAADDGSGVVAILETVRALGARALLRNDLIVLITDAEEVGLLGARAFVDEHPWLDDVAVLIAFEMRGGGGPSMMFETGANNGWVIEAFRRADPYPAANSVSYEIYQRMRNDTDFTPFKEAGKQGLNFAAIGKAHVYHQFYDSPENLSEGTLQHHGEHALAMLEYFGNADLSNVDAPDVSYISVPFVGLVTYGPLWIRVLGGAAVGAWLLACIVARKGGARVAGMLAGVGMSAVYLGLVFLVADALYNWREGAHPELGALLAGSFHSEGWYLLAILCAAFALAAVIAGVLRRWFSLPELAVGALLVPVALAAAATVRFPFAAMNFQWPAVAGCVGALAVCGLQRGQRMGLVRWIVVTLAAVPVVVVLTPLTEGVWLAMGLALSEGLALLLGLGFLMLLPALDAAREPNGWWAPVAGLIAAGAFLAVGMSTATPSPERPAPSTLVYMLDHETGTAYWGTDRNRHASDPGVAWAIAAAGPFAAPGADPPAAFTRERLRYTFASAEPTDIPPPNITVVEDENLPGDVLRVAVTSEIGAERMSFTIPEDGPRLAAVNGLLLPAGSESPDSLVHWGTPPAGGLILDFIRPPGDRRLSFTLVEHHLRPGELVGAHYFTRLPELAPNIRTLSDRAIIRSRVNLGGNAGLEPADSEGVDSAGAQSAPPDTLPADTVQTDTLQADTGPARSPPTPTQDAPRWPPAGTFSIVGYDPETGEVGVAVQSRVFSVGNGVIWGEAGVGVVATQAIVDVSYGPQALALLREGYSPEDAVREILARDPDPDPDRWTKEGRQFSIMNARGEVATHTGPRASDWAGHRIGEYCSAQGNILAGPAVVDGMVEAFESTEGHLSLRLQAALEAGQAAGGDTRGMQSAAMLIVQEDGGVWLNNDVVLRLQVDDHEQPIAELRRLVEIAARRLERRRSRGGLN